jgi:hypothetical protein
MYSSPEEGQVNIPVFYLAKIELVTNKLEN